jgi:nucleotide-binding universal stress UspA family protein
MSTYTTEAAVAIKNILYPTDFSEGSLVALPYAASLARQFGAKIFVTHVSPEAPGVPASVREGLAALHLTSRDDARPDAAFLRSYMPGIHYELLFRKGAIWPELSQIVNEKAMDLIVTGTHGRTGVSKLLSGSVAEEIFRHAVCPVLTVGPTVSGEAGSIADLHEILLATDFSAESLAALPYTISLAQQDRARVYLLHVATEPVRQQSEDVLKARLLDLIPLSAKLSCAPRAFVRYGLPAAQITEFAEQFGVDLIVLGVRRTPSPWGSSRHLPRATAYRVACEALCPLLTVRAGGAS